VKHKRKRATSAKNHEYIENALQRLMLEPKKLGLLRQNCQTLAAQYSMNKGLLRAIERFEWVFSLDDDIERICIQIRNDDYIGKQIRRYPLLFKGV
jgi:hypothetical protein